MEPVKRPSHVGAIISTPWRITRWEFTPSSCVLRVEESFLCRGVGQHHDGSPQSFHAIATDELITGRTQKRPNAPETTLLGWMPCSAGMIVIDRQPLPGPRCPLADGAPTSLSRIEPPIVLGSNAISHFGTPTMRPNPAGLGDITMVRIAARPRVDRRTRGSDPLLHTIPTRLH